MVVDIPDNDFLRKIKNLSMIPLNAVVFYDK